MSNLGLLHVRFRLRNSGRFVLVPWIYVPAQRAVSRLEGPEGSKVYDGSGGRGK
jgi:hypothetical protein